MTQYHLTDEEWITLRKECGSALIMSQKTGISQRSVSKAEDQLKLGLKYNSSLMISVMKGSKKIAQTTGHTRRGMDIEKGRVIVFSDAHF